MDKMARDGDFEHGWSLMFMIPMTDDVGILWR